MTCIAPVNTLTVPANTTRLGMRGGVHVTFYMPTGGTLVHWALVSGPPLPGLHWWLTNSVGSVLQQADSSGVASGAWSLSTAGDPHTLWFTTDFSILGGFLSQTVTYDLEGACTQPGQTLPCTTTSCPAGFTCVNGVCVPNTTPPPPGGGGSPSLLPLVAVGAAALGGYYLWRHQAAPPAVGQARRRR